MAFTIAAPIFALLIFIFGCLLLRRSQREHRVADLYSSIMLFIAAVFILYAWYLVK